VRWLALPVALTLAACGGDSPTPTDDPEDEAGEEGGDAGDGGGPSAEGEPPPAALKKLRTFEYENSIADLLGVDVTTQLPEDFVRASFTSVAAAADCYDDLSLEDLERAALDVAGRAFAASPDPLSAAGCEPASATDACVRQFVADFGRKAWRRSLSDDELDKYAGLLESLANLYSGDVRKGAELTVAALVQSPYFLYRVELGEPTDGGVRKYTPSEMATRLAFTLWESPPDETLLAAAENGELTTAESVREHAERMMKDPRSIDPLFRFWREHLGIDRLTLTNYPRAGVDAALYHEMREEGRHLAYQLALPGADALSYLTSSTGYLHPGVASRYGIDLDTEAEVELPPERRGFLTSAVFLISNSHPDKTSPTRRGKFVLERVLCRNVPPPPADVDLELPDALPGEATGRQVLDQHSSDPTCAACHVQLDPPGFAFEAYGPDAGMRELDNGLAIDSSGTMDGQQFAGASELIDILASTPDAARCVTLQTFRSATSSLEGVGQAAYLQALAESFTENGHDQRQLMIDLVSSDAFRFATGFAGQ